MRFRIKKDQDNTVYSIVVSGEVEGDAGWDLLQIAQTMLNTPQCGELIIDLRSAMIEVELAVLNTDTLVSVFEEGLLKKDSTLIIRLHDDSEICLCSDQLPLDPTVNSSSVSINEAKFYGRAMK